MFQEFNKLSGNSKIWIYNAGRTLNSKEKEKIHKSAKEFCSHWAAHGKPLNSSYEVLYDQFLILAVDESANPVSGCSIDESVYFVRELSDILNVDLLNRDVVTFLDKDSSDLISMTLKEAKEKAQNGMLNIDWLVFNNFVLSKSALTNNWIIPLKESWLKNRLSKNISL